MSAARPAPSLDDELMRLLKRMRLPYIRNAAPELLATAKAQRWEPAEVLKALLAEEVTGRDRSALATRRLRAGFPTGKTFAAWDPALSSVPAHPGCAAHPGMDPPPGKPGDLRAIRHRQDVPARGPRAASRRSRPPCCVV